MFQTIEKLDQSDILAVVMRIPILLEASIEP